VEEGIWKVQRGRGRYRAIWGDLSGSHLEGTGAERCVQGYLGRPECKKAFGRYRGGGGTGLFGQTGLEEVIWKVQSMRGGSGLFGETCVEEGIWKVRRSRDGCRVIWGDRNGGKHLEGTEGETGVQGYLGRPEWKKALGM